MKIQGIRSFDHKRSETIYFHAPLTLIVGQNGCGKTTIIECLKFATTGQQPPNSKGGAFVHDPKLTAGETEVQGQVKLEFMNASQNRLVVSRMTSVTAKKSGLTQRTIDCTLLINTQGERHTMTTKVAEMDKIIPAQMGVTAAVLDNVIFCHQDESLWPMSEPSKLKEKFDKIFDADKYTKAIDNMIKMRKSHKEELGKLIIHEANFKLMKDKAERVQRRSIALEREIDKLRQKIIDFDADINAASEETTQKKKAANLALGTVEELRTKKDRADGYQKFLQDLKHDLEELEESDEWLQSTIDQYEERMSQYRQESTEYQSQYSEFQAVLAISRQQGAEKQVERGQYQAQKKNYEAQIRTRIQLVREAARIHTMRGYDGSLEENQIQEFVDRIQKLFEEKELELDHIRKCTNDDLREIQVILSELENRQATRVQEKVNARQTITANDKKVKTRQQEIDAIRMDEGAKAALDISLGDVQQRLLHANAKYDTARWDEKLNMENMRLREFELEANHLKAELFQSNKLANDRAALEYAKTQAKAAQRSLDTMIEIHNGRLTSVVGASWTPDTLAVEFQTILDQRSQALSEAKREQDGAERELREHEFQLKTSSSSLKKMIEEKHKCQTAVLSSIFTSNGEPLTSMESYLEELKALETEQNGFREDLSGASVVRGYYEKSLKTIQEKNCCRLCERTFTDCREKIAATEKIEKLMSKLVREEMESGLIEIEAELRKANAVRPQYENYMKLNIEIPALAQEVENLEVQKTRLVSRCEYRDSLVNKETSSLRDFEALSSTVNSIVKYHLEISKHEEEISRLSSQQKLSGCSMTVDEIQDKLAACDEKIGALRNKIEKLSDDKGRIKSEIASLEMESGNLTQRLSAAQFQLEKKRDLLAAVEELREDTTQQYEAIQKADEDLDALSLQFTKAKVQHDDARRQGEAKAKEVQADKDKLAQTSNKFRLVNDSINEYIETGGPGKLLECEMAIQNIEREQKHIEDELIRLTSFANELNARIGDSEKTKRSILANIRFRKTRRDLEVINQEIAELEARIVDEDAERLVHEHIALEKRTQNMIAERGPLLGAVRAKDGELGVLINEWETDYKDAAVKYREIHIKVETTKAAIEDVIKCTQAVDHAIMKYHTMKMDEINSIAGDLWCSTYTGTDVDTILIRAENDTSNTSKRNYNYRLCMVKGDAEIDMRGRCSAGQRVLASIIIRLALAECFGVSCGVIALDEPTTNLDRENITALAESLNRLIKARKRQNNFQLIIITHDEEFLKGMHCCDFTEHYWRIHRGADQNSIIERQSLKDLV